MFSVGQKVVCINDTWEFAHHIEGVTLPSKGVVYTIRDIVMGYGHDGFAPGLLLSEIRNPIGAFETEYNFGPSRFRPIVSRPTSIEIFKKMLTPTTEKETSQCRTGSSTE